MAAHSNSTHASTFHAGAVPVPPPDLQPETVAMLAALLDPPGVKRRGRIVACAVRYVPRLVGAELGLSPALI